MLSNTTDHIGTPRVGIKSVQRDSTPQGFGLDALTATQLRKSTVIQNSTSMSDSMTLPSSAFDLKHQFSQIAMHLTGKWRTGIFRQIDQILDPDDWEDNVDMLPSTDAWRTLLRLLVYFKFKSRPGLSLNQERPILSWNHHDIRISIECFPNDKVRWVASRDSDGEREAVAGETNVLRFRQFVRPFNDDDWLVDGAN